MTRQTVHTITRPPLSFAGDALPLVAALLMSAVFLTSGVTKLVAPQQTIAYIKAVGLPFPPAAFAVAVALEIGGGLALVLGFGVRPVAVALAAYCLVTGLVFHHALADPNQFAHFFKNVALAGGLLQIAASGRRRLSLEALRR